MLNEYDPVDEFDLIVSEVWTPDEVRKLTVEAHATDLQNQEKVKRNLTFEINQYGIKPDLTND